eukprot:m.17752 g.17752  ORF g.17752 m.17752 type:complete len:62 (+) comp27546_c0_seq6:809-994(+)
MMSMRGCSTPWTNIKKQWKDCSQRMPTYEGKTLACVFSWLNCSRMKLEVNWNVRTLIASFS